MPHALALPLLVLLLLSGCGREADKPSQPKGGNTTAAPATAGPPPPTTSTPASSPSTSASAEDRARTEARNAAQALLTRWMSAQNTGDATSYFALYEQKEFKGLKRTHRGKVASFDFPAWRKDRTGMFKGAVEVAVEDVEIATWLEPESTLKEGLSRVRFVQRWRSKTYADHGPKTLLLWRDPRDGQPKIVFEELLLSRPGWDDASAAEGLDFPGLARAATVEEMTSAVQQARLSIHSASDAASELSDPFHQGLLAQALVGLGSLNCIDAITSYQCGEPVEDWGEVENASIEHACVRRAALLPLLEDAALPEDALAAIEPALTAVLADDKAERDPELGAAILTGTRKLPEPRRLAILGAALKHENRWAEAAAPWIAKLSATALYALWELCHNPAVLRLLPVSEHAQRLAAIHLEPSSLPNDLMLPVVTVLRAQAQRTTLAALAADENCELAMSAASALAELGDSSKLPEWKTVTDVEGARRAICMLRHDPNKSRSRAELGRFFLPSHAVRSVTLRVHENELAEADVPESTSEEQAEVERAHELLHAKDRRGERTASVEKLENPGPDLLLESRAFEAQSETDYDVVELFLDGGRVYVDYVGTYEYEWTGCPC